MTIYTILGGNNDVNPHFIGVLGGGAIIMKRENHR